MVKIDRNGHSILHHACLFRAPADIIQMILWQAPELAGISNPDGEVPLHWAVRLAAPNEQIESLVAACPEAATWAKDKNGKLMCTKILSFAVSIRNPQRVVIVSYRIGLTPLSLLWDRFRDHILDLWWRDSRKVQSLHSWKRLMLLFPHRSHGPNQDEKEEEGFFETLLHVACESPCPVGLFPLLVQIFRQDVLIKDTDGRLPLHRACSNAISNRSSDVSSKVQLLLQVSKESASSRDVEGRTPFHVALEAGISWDEGLCELVQSNPSLLNGRDPRTNLDPVLLAATAENGVTTDKPLYVSTEGIKNPLDTVYKLLRMDPSRIASL